MPDLRIGGELRVSGASAAQTEAIVRRARTVERVRERRFGGLVWTEQEIELFRWEGSDLVVPRGMLSMILEVVPGITIADERTTAPASFKSLCEWRAHQIGISKAIETHETCIALASTGSGKTGAACASIARLGQRTIVLVPTVDLARQWKTEVKRFLGFDAVVCSGGTWTDTDIVIATPETAIRHADRLTAFGLCVVDECHLFGTARRLALLAMVPARFRLGLTATLPTDHKRAMTMAAMGAVRFRYTVTNGVADGVLVAPRYVQVPTAFDAPYADADDWAGLLEALVHDTPRIALVVDLVVNECAGATTLVLSARIAHLEALCDAMKARGLRAAIVSGAVPKRAREAALDAARAGELDVLLGSVVADQGIDLPALGNVVLAFPGRSEPRLLQRIGRVLRAAPGKAQPIVYDIVDDCGPLRRQAEIRARSFAETFRQARVA